MSNAIPELAQTVMDFKKWLQSDSAQQHLRIIENEKKEVKELMYKLGSLIKTVPNSRSLCSMDYYLTLRPGKQRE